MVKHVIIWDLKEEFSEKEREMAKAKVKEGLEGLKDKIDGLEEIKVIINPLSSSNGDMMLDSTFRDEEALIGYQSNPYHVEVATYVRSVVSLRRCFDYVI